MTAVIKGLIMLVSPKHATNRKSTKYEMTWNVSKIIGNDSDTLIKKNLPV